MAVTVTRTLQLSGVPAALPDSALEERLADFGPMKRCFVVKKKRKGPAEEGDGTTTGYVEFADAADAASCLESTGGVVKVGGDGAEVRLRMVPDKQERGKREAEGAPAHPGGSERPDYQKMREGAKLAKVKKARLIVRNLSFKASDNELRCHFESVGKVAEVHILKRPDGRRVGCAFVQMDDVRMAAKAIKKLNGSELKGRTVAVDWAMGKKEYQQENGKAAVKEEPEEAMEVKQEVEDDGEVEVKQEQESEEEEDEDMDEDGEDDEEDDEDEEEDGDKPEKKWHNLKTGHDVNEGLTVFVRNLSFDSEEEDLAGLCRERFGPVHFARLVVNRDTGHPKGTAFVKFREADAAKAMIAASEGGQGEDEEGREGLWLDDRRIYAVAAMAKEDADEAQKKKKEKEKKDSRNLHLAVEGLVRKGTQAAVGVSDADLQRRVQVERWKRSMLKDLNMFISPHRLCVRNLPSVFADRQLKKLAASHSDRSAVITEAKVILAEGGAAKAGGGAGGGKAGAANKGYGFVTFTKHDDALKFLRAVNNNPAVFTKNARPIVEFSVENRKALNAREKRLQKSRDNNPNAKGGAAAAAGKNKSERNRAAKAEKFQRKKEKDQVGEKAPFMGSVNNPNVRSLPSHIGEKVRHNKRPAITRKDLRLKEKEKKDPKKAARRKRKLAAVEAEAGAPAAAPEAKKPKTEKKKKKGKSKEAVKDFKDEKKFAAMVQQYKQKLNTTSYKPVAGRAKWFDS